MKLKKLLIYSIFTLIFFTGCWDKIEIENRAFVLSLGIDKFTSGSGIDVSSEKNIVNRFAVSISMPQLLDQPDQSDENTNRLKTSASATISSAMDFSDSISSQKLFFGHTKLAVLGEEILKNRQLFRETVDALERNPEISRKILVMSTDKSARDILGFKESIEPVSIFISNFYKNNVDGSAVTFKQTLENLVLDLRTAGNTIIPKVSIIEDSLNIGGAAIIKDFEFVDWLNSEEMRGYLFVKESALNANIITRFEDTFVPLDVTKNKTKIHFVEDETGENLICYIFIDVHGVVDEFTFTEESLATEKNLSDLSYLYKTIIEREVNACLSKFSKHDIDGLFLKEFLRKQNFSLYEKYAYRDDFFDIFKIIPIAEVAVEGTGSVI